MKEFKYIHIGNKIAGMLDDLHKTKRDLALDIGMSPSNAVYLTSRETIDVRTLHKIGVALKYNFFKHFPIEEPGTAPISPEKDKMIGDLKVKIAWQEKVIEDMKRELEMMKIENGYLKEINGLLKGK